MHACGALRSTRCKATAPHPRIAALAAGGRGAQAVRSRRRTLLLALPPSPHLRLQGWHLVAVELVARIALPDVDARHGCGTAWNRERALTAPRAAREAKGGNCCACTGDASMRHRTGKAEAARVPVASQRHHHHTITHGWRVGRPKNVHTRLAAYPFSQASAQCTQRGAWQQCESAE